MRAILSPVLRHTHCERLIDLSIARIDKNHPLPVETVQRTVHGFLYRVKCGVRISARLICQPKFVKRDTLEAAIYCGRRPGYCE